MLSIELVSRISALYDQIDQAVAEFQIKTGLRCPHGCGICCPTKRVFTTPFEMLPEAVEILSQGDEAQWFERIALATFTGTCVLYQIDRAPEAPGHCGLYAFRPAICRLFGYGAVHSRSGEKALAICGHLKKTGTQQVLKAMEIQQEAPDMVSFTSQIYGLVPGSRLELLTINEALYNALMRIGLGSQLSSDQLHNQATAA